MKIVNPIKDRIPRGPIAVILLASFVLMVYGTWRLEPHLMIPDETGAVQRALRIGYERDPFINSFKKGGNLHLYLLAASFVPVVLVWIVTGRFQAITSSAVGISPEIGWEAPPLLLQAYYDVAFAGRLSSVLLGVGTVYLVYRMADEIASERAGLYAAGFLTVSMGYVTTAHYATEDVPQTFFVMLTLLLLVQAYRREAPRRLLLSAVTAGLAISMKATSGLLIAPLAWLILRQHWVRERPDPATLLYRIGRYPLLTMGAYMLTTPSLLFHFASWRNEVFRYVSANTGGALYSHPDPSWLIAVGNLASALGLPLFLLASGSTGYVLYRLARDEIDRSLWLLLSFAGPLLILLSFVLKPQYFRFIPLLPFFAVFSGITVSTVLDSTRITPSWRHAFRVAVAAVVVFSTIYTAAAVVGFNTSRIEATEWNDANFGSDSEIDVHAQRVYLPEFPEEAEVNRYVIHSSYPRSAWREGLVRLRANCPEYVVLSSFHYDRFFVDPSVFPAVTEEFDRLMDEEGYEIVRTFGPPMTRDPSAMRNLRQSLTFHSFPETGNPTIIVLRRTAEPTEACA